MCSCRVTFSKTQLIVFQKVFPLKYWLLKKIPNSLPVFLWCFLTECHSWVIYFLANHVVAKIFLFVRKGGIAQLAAMEQFSLQHWEVWLRVALYGWNASKKLYCGGPSQGPFFFSVPQCRCCGSGVITVVTYFRQQLLRFVPLCAVYQGSHCLQQLQSQSSCSKIQHSARVGAPWIWR